MTRNELRAAGDSLREAADSAPPELAAQLEDRAETVASLAERKTGPDHGRLARFEHGLRSLQDSADADVSDRIDDAVARIHAYRETIEGV